MSQPTRIERPSRIHIDEHGAPNPLEGCVWVDQRIQQIDFVPISGVGGAVGGAMGREVVGRGEVGRGEVARGGAWWCVVVCGDA